MDEREEALAHFGVKGMKWGVRKSRSNSVTSPSKKSNPSKKVTSDQKPPLDIPVKSLVNVGIAGARVGAMSLLASAGVHPVISTLSVGALAVTVPTLISAGSSWLKGENPFESKIIDRSGPTKMRNPDTGVWEVVTPRSSG